MKTEMSCADLDLICAEEAHGELVDKIRGMINHYERLRDWQMRSAKETASWDLSISFMDDATNSERIVRILQELL